MCRHNAVAAIEMVGGVTEEIGHDEYELGGETHKYTYTDEHACLRVTYAGRTVEAHVTRSKPEDGEARRSYDQLVWQGPALFVAMIGRYGKKLHPVGLEATTCKECGGLFLAEAHHQYGSSARIVGWREDAPEQAVGKWSTH